MARTISTKLAIEGESAYKQAIASCNSELSTLKSNLTLVESEFRSNANSLEALTAKGSALEAMYEGQQEKIATLEEALKNAAQAQEGYAARVAAAQEHIQRYEQELEKLRQSTEDTAEEQKALTAELDEWNAELDEAEAGLTAAERGVQGWQKQLNNAKVELNSLSDKIEQNSRHLQEAKDSADGCAASINQYGEAVKGAGKSSGEFAEGSQRSKEGIEQLAAVLAAAGVAKTVKEIGDALTGCVDAFAAFEAQMSTVQAISGATGKQLAALGDKAKYMGATTSFTATEAAEALEYMAMAGWKPKDMLDGLEGIMNLAAASGENLASTSDIVTDALTAFGLAASDSGRFADVLAAASSNANTNVAMMGETFKYAAPVAGALGYSIEDTALAIGLMANAGIKGSQAGTALRGTLTNLAKPSDEVAGYMEKLGISLTDSTGRTRTLSELMDILRERFSALTEAQKAEYAAGIAGKQAMSGLLAIVNAAEGDYQKLKEAIDGSNGSAKEMSEIRLDNLAGQMTLLKSASDGLKTAIGEALAPALRGMAEAGTDALSWATEFIGKNEWLVQALTGAIGAVGLLTAGIAGYIAVTTAAKAAQDALNLSIGLCPLVAVTAAVGALIFAIGSYVASMNNGGAETREFTKSLQESKNAYKDLVDEMVVEQASARSTADALKNLLAVEGRSATQKRVLKELVDQLNEAVPGLGLAYDETADSINMTTEAIDAMLSKEADQEVYNAQVKRLSDLYTDQAEISARLEEAQGVLTDAQSQTREEMAACFDIAVDYNRALEESNGAANALSNNVRELTAAQEANAAEIAALEAETEAYAQQQAQAAQETGAMTSKIEGLIAQMTELEAAYTENYNAAMDSITSQLGLFNELDGSAKTSIENLISTLEGQVKYMDDYAANIQKAMELGVNEGLIRKLSDGSEKSAQILAAIAQGGEEEIAALNEQLAKVEEGKESFSDTIAAMETDFDEKMTAMVQDLEQAIQEMDLHDEAYKAGVNDIQGLIDGMEYKRGEAVTTAASIARDVQAAYLRESDQHSPSKKFEKAGKNDIQGLIQGAQAETPNLMDTYASAAMAALESYQKAAAEGVANLQDIAATFKGLDHFFSVKGDVGSLEYQLWERTDGKNASDAEKYAQKLAMLSAQQEDQETVVEAAAAAYEAVVEQYGAASEESYEYQKALLQEKLALQDLMDEIEQVTNAKRNLAQEEFIKQAQLAWENSALGNASAAANSAGYITPYEVAKTANTGIVMPDDFEAAAQDVIYKMAGHLPATLEAPRTSETLGRQMEAISSATVNAISGIAQGMGSGSEKVRVVTIDGKVLAEATFDDFVDYSKANGTPIVNPKK